MNEWLSPRQCRLMSGSGGNRVTEIAHHACRQGFQLPSGNIAVQFVAPSDPVRIFDQIDQPDSPRFGCYGLRRQQDRARFWICAGTVGQADYGRNLGQRDAAALVSLQLQHREINVVQLVQHFIEILVAFRAVAVRFAEQDIEHDGARVLPLYALQQFGMDCARPRPASSSGSSEPGGSRGRHSARPALESAP